MLAVFSSPSRYTQGKNATAELGKEMKALGLEGPALIIAGRSALKLLSETWKQSLGVASIKHSVHLFGGECSLAEIERGKTEAKKQGARPDAGRALLSHAARRRRRCAARRADAGRDAGPGAARGGQHLALRAGLRVVRPGGGACDPQRPDRGTGDTRLFSRRESGLRHAHAARSRGQAADAG